MPLGFASLSHGRVAFGFFHIETDMLLLESMFFFADDFCALLTGLAAAVPGAAWRGEMPGWRIDGPACLGDLHGAIAGRDRGGFLGALYGRRPFPAEPEAFRQKAAGALARAEVEQEIARWGAAATITASAGPAQGVFTLGGVAFDARGPARLADYVWRGGMPGWQEGRRPPYLLEAAQAWRASASPWLAGLDLDPARLGFAF